jgi:methyltransferase (TIGR00027 family)
MTEDAALAACDRGLCQYAILGAGLDSFAWRHADRLPALQVFEIDHPGTQSWKRAMIADLGAVPPRGLHFVPADLRDMPVQRALANGGWDFTRPGFISWIAVTMYLQPDVVAAMLAALATLGTGTTVALTYLQPEQALDAGERDILASFRGTTTASGEPCMTHYANMDMHALLSAAGFATVTLHAPRASAYFRDRRDGLMPHNVEMLAVASVT